MAFNFFKTLLSSIAPHVALDVVVIYRERGLGAWLPCRVCEPDPVCIRHGFRPRCDLRAFKRQFWLLGQMRSLRDFRLILCVDVYDCVVDYAVELLEPIVWGEEAEWGFVSLCEPLIVCEKRMIRGSLSDSPAGASSDWIVASAL